MADVKRPARGPPAVQVGLLHAFKRLDNLFFLEADNIAPAPETLPMTPIPALHLHPDPQLTLLPTPTALMAASLAAALVEFLNY